MKFIEKFSITVKITNIENEMNFLIRLWSPSFFFTYPTFIYPVYVPNFLSIVDLFGQCVKPNVKG